jgi:hypothetical protein
MGLIILAAAVCFAAPAQDVPLTLELRATPARHAVLEIAKAAGVQVGIEAALADEILIIKVRDVSSRDLLAKIADALHARLEEVDGGYHIHRPTALRRELEEREYRARVKWLQRLLEAKKEELARDVTPLERAESTVRAARQLLKDQEDAGAGLRRGVSLDGPRLASPAARLLNELVVEIGAEELARLPMFESEEYDSTPELGAHSLPSRWRDLVADYLETERLLAQRLAPGDPQQDAGSRSLMGAYGMTEILEGASKPGGAHRVELVVRRRTADLGFSLVVYAADGTTRATAFGGTSFLDGNTYMQERAVPHIPGAKKVELSPLSAELHRFWMNDPNVFRPDDERPPSSGEPSEALMDALVNPERVDPLAFSASDGLLALAGERSRNLVACPTDSLHRTALLAIVGGELDLRRFEALLGPSARLLSEEEGDWLLVRPASPLYDEAFRLERGALGKLMRASRRAGEIEIQPYCRMHYELGPAKA